VRQHVFQYPPPAEDDALRLDGVLFHQMQHVAGESMPFCQSSRVTIATSGTSSRAAGRPVLEGTLVSRAAVELSASKVAASGRSVAGSELINQAA